MTSLQKFNSVFCILNIVICAILLFDDYVAGTFTVPEICKEKRTTVSHSRVGKSWDSYLVTTFSQKEYNLPYNAFYSIEYNDSFTIHRTKIFKKAVGVTYTYKDNSYFEKIGVINGNGFGLFVIILCITASVILLLFTMLFNKKFEVRHILMFSFICLVIIYFYFINQS
jgi:hypothetical protein